ncbi:carboxypeptidase N subunit 2 [Parasteatoda tepidariorum]|nr:carboxypeptidase N subunit 2 [Parasteatoda tepidariorum]
MELFNVKSICLFLSLIVLGRSQLEEKCPTTNIWPCTCKTYLDGACIITCSLATQEQVDKIADIPNLCDGDVHFMLVHSKISGISSKLWKVLLSSKTVDVSIKRATVEGLVRPGDESIPSVYTPGAAVIKVDHSKVENFNWKQFSKFYSEGELTIVVEDTHLTELTPEFGEIASGQVEKVAIESAGLKVIRDHQFEPFADLESLSLQNNELTSISRSILAKPAKKLQFLHLNGNSLTSIPVDLFSDMPALEVVYLRENNLVTLPQDLFSSISSPNLQRIDFVNNPWHCDCRLMWILKNSKYHLNMGICATPDSLAGKKIKSNMLEC